MGILDSLGKAAKSIGGKAIHEMTALPGAIWDTATYVVPGDFLPGDRGYGDFSDYLNSLGGRANDLAFSLPVTQAMGKGLEGLNWAYHKGIDQPLSTAMIVASHDDSGGGFWDFTHSDTWSQAYKIADTQSFGKSAIYAVTNDKDPFADAGHTVKTDNGEQTLSPFEYRTAQGNNALLANVAALTTDLTTSWFLDPTVLAGKGASIAREKHLGKIAAGDRANFDAKLLDGSLPNTKPVSWTNRTGEFIRKVVNADKDGNRLGPSLNAAEIRGMSVELQRSRGGLAISSALEKAAAIEDPVEAGDAVRRVLAVAAGDQGAINSLAVMGTESKALADRLNNILSEKTVDLTEQALNEMKATDPVFRAAFNRQISNWNDAADLKTQLSNWSAQVENDLKGVRTLKENAGGLDYLPGVHRNTDRLLNKAQGNSIATKVDQAHEEILTRLRPERDSHGVLKQDGLGTIPLLALYPARLLVATSPTRLVPKIVNGLRTVHYGGVYNLHDWDASITTMNSLLIHAGTNDGVRNKVISKAMGLRTESEKTSMIHEAETVAMHAAMENASAKHGIEIDKEFVTAALQQGLTKRAAAMAAQNGTRYSAAEQAGSVLDRSRAVYAGALAQREGSTATKVADAADNWKPTVDQFLDETGTPYTLPIASSQLANRVPGMDITGLKQALGDHATFTRLSKRSQEFRQAATEIEGLQAGLKNLRANQYDRQLRRIQNLRKTQEAILGTMSELNRLWKLSVLFRLGYPMRVIGDDHMRIAARMGYFNFVMANLPEAAKNTYYNYMPGFLARGAGATRTGDSYLAFEAIKQQRNNLRIALGRQDAHTDAEWGELQGLLKTKLAGKAGDSTHARLKELDPDGRVEEYVDLKRQLAKHTRSATAHRNQLAIMRENGATEAQIRAKEAKLATAEGNARAASEMLAGRIDPDEVRKQLRTAQDSLLKPARALKPEKRRIGSADIETEAGTFGGSFNTSASAWREAASSNETWADQALPELEGMAYRQNSAGAWKSIEPSEAGYYSYWANVLNHQFQHSPELMAFVKGEVKSPQEFAAWLRHPDRANIRERMYYYAHDAEDWGGRLQSMSDDYLAHNDELRAAVAKGRVNEAQLKRMFPEGDGRRPSIHGQAIDVNTGRASAVRMMNEGLANAFAKIATLPTDRLSRQPFFNAVYKREIQEAAQAHIAAKGAEARFSDADRMAVEKMAREKALQELRTTLWDVSAHSSMAHTLRFISPFMAAHQEALNRWWNIARDDPSVARRFTLAFDAPRKAGMVYDPSTGEPVRPGETIGGNHRILLRIPFAGKNNAINKWLDKHHAGNFSVSENGFNLILQNGNVINPGVGPYVTVPVESLVAKYPEATEFEKVARVLNQYPPASNSIHGIIGEQLTPGWGKHMQAYFQGPGNAEFARYFAQNFSDDLVTWNLNHNRPPNEAELQALQDQVNKETHRDLVLMAMTNLVSFTPARPSSRYTAVQSGLQKLYEQMQTEGHDMDWLRQNFVDKFGEAYLPLVYSLGTNPGNLTGSTAEVSAIKKYKGITSKVDPSLVRMVIGPEVSSADDAAQMYSQSAARWESTQGSGEPGTNLRGKKDPRDLARAQVVQEGWNQYDSMTNYLDYLADQRGENKGYEAYPDLVAKKQAGMAYIQQQNPVFAHEYESYQTKSFDKLVDQMKMIVSNKALASDPSRPDIYWLGQYIQVRQYMTNALAQRAAAGGNKTIGAKANADLAQAYRNAITYINSQSPYFKQFSYPVIERDPLLNPTEGQ